MAFRPDYLLKETGQNLLRNPSLSLATILTVAISLSLMGASLLIQGGLNRVNTRFKDDVEFFVWMDLEATDEQIAATADFLDSSPFVRQHKFIDRDTTWAEFQEFFADQPDVLRTTSKEDLPESFEVSPNNTNAAAIQSIGSQVQQVPGVDKVAFAADLIEDITQFSKVSSRIMLVAALTSAVAAALLMYNSIRTAVFARRREIEVMRLVGATKWFIRIPFMLEGLVQGMIGAFLSVFSVFALNKVFDDLFASFENRLLVNVTATSQDILTDGLVLLFFGAVIGAAGAGLAVTRYLDA